MGDDIPCGQMEQVYETVHNKKVNFSRCPVVYDGRSQFAAVETFLIAIKVFMKMEQISETEALYQMPLVLQGSAAAWWRTVKDNITTWTEFEESIRKVFSPIPTHEIYQQIYTKQPSDMNTEAFIRSKRSLFMQLPLPDHPEQQQIDMIYGLLKSEIRNKIPRHTLSSFNQLLNFVKDIEDTEFVAPTKVKRTRCNYCKVSGHVSKDCRKKGMDRQDRSCRPMQIDSQGEGKADDGDHPSTSSNGADEDSLQTCGDS